MVSNYWMKLYYEILDDPKMGRLPEILFARCIKLFLLAGENNKGGLLPPIPDIAWRLRIPEEEVESDLIELQRSNITTQKDGEWWITKWKERQAPMTSTERSRRFREKQKSLEYEQNGPADVGVRADDETSAGRSGDEGATNRPTDTDIDIDTDTDAEEITTSSSAHARQTVASVNNMRSLIRAWEKAAGPITAMIAEHLEDLADECEQRRQGLPGGSEGAGIEGSRWVEMAIEEGSKSADRLTIKYVQAILDRWMREGFQAKRARGKDTSDRRKFVEDAEKWGIGP